jgi:hypothetical protein
MIFTKPRRKVSKVYIHCSASDRPEHDDVSVMREWHTVGNGWNDVGYHYFIRKDGLVQAGRPLEVIPAAQKGHNRRSIAICLHGLDKARFTERQFSSLRHLCAQIYTAYDGNVTFHGHREVAAKACPVFDYQKVLGLDSAGRMRVQSDAPPPPPAKPDIVVPAVVAGGSVAAVGEAVRSGATNALAIGLVTILVVGVIALWRLRK